VLPREHACQRTASHGTAPDEDLPEEATHPLLLGEGALELCLSKQALVDEERPEGAPGEVGLVHEGVIGRSGLAE
jgi:hypothetical protein